MVQQKNKDKYKILISGAELVELKRRAYNIPECPGLDKRIQKYRGDKPFAFTFDELRWLTSVLDAVLKDSKGYPCIEHNPWKLEYVPTSDERCKTCKELYSRLRKKEDEIWESRRKQYLKIKKKEQKLIDNDTNEEEY